MNPFTQASEWPEWRQSAELFAFLANVKTLSELEEWQKVKLVSDVEKLDSLGEDLLHTAAGLPGRKAAKQQAVRLKLAGKNKEFITSWSGEVIPYRWLAIWDVHPFAYELVNQLLNDGQKVDVRNLRERVYLLRPVAIQEYQGRGVVIMFDPTEMALDGLFGYLWRTITLCPFPFRRCPVCNGVFVPVKKQKFCVKACANKSLGPRTEYMREYMRDKRRLSP